jgi:hypothetical protein
VVLHTFMVAGCCDGWTIAETGNHERMQNQRLQLLFLGSFLWAVCRPKHDEQLRNTGIINSTTWLRLVGSFYEIYITIHGSMNIKNYVTIFKRDFVTSAETSDHKMVRDWLHRYCTFAYCSNVAVWSLWKKCLRNLSLGRSARAPHYHHFSDSPVLMYKF